MDARRPHQAGTPRPGQKDSSRCVRCGMSYCRWSSDHFECDVYVYADVSGGWTTHVAGRRRKHRVPDDIKAAFPAHGEPHWVERYMAAEDAVDAWEATLPHDDIPCNYMEKDGSTRPGTYRSLKDSEYIDLSEIGPEAGESYSHDTPGECADWLAVLLAKGFNVPQRAIDALREEQADMDKESTADTSTAAPR
jgi:hypothetical protein